jgi:hypothetical protein
MSAKQEHDSALNTFIVRFWRGQEAGRSCWCGQVQCVQSGACIAFSDEASLLDFIRRWVQMPEGKIEKTFQDR